MEKKGYFKENTTWRKSIISIQANQKNMKKDKPSQREHANTTQRSQKMENFVNIT